MSTRTTKLSTRLCALNDIANNGCKEFYPNGEALFAVRRDHQVFIYRNRCPHTGMPLNWQPDQFFDLDKKYIQCAVHAAIFKPDSGYCVAGPCAGESLQKIPCDIQEGSVYIDLPT